MRHSLIIAMLLSLLPVTLQAATYKPDGDLIGNDTIYTVKKGDGLPEIARKFDLGLAELLRANPAIDSQKKPAPGTQLTIASLHVLPAAPRKGIVLNLSELRLFYFAADGNVTTYPVAIGREGWETPLGETTIVMKRKDPVWTIPKSIRAENPDLPETMPAGPDNPLGAYAISLGWPGYAIHGTNHPYAVGKRTSHGCIRLYPEDIEALYNTVEKGLTVTVVDAPYKLGWRGDVLYLEAAAGRRKITDQSRADIKASFAQAAPNAAIDWPAVEKAVAEHTGIPVAVGKKRGFAALFR